MPVASVCCAVAAMGLLGVAEVPAAIVTYCLVSGSMLLVNKLTMEHVQLPAFVLLCQFGSAGAAVYMAKVFAGLVVDDFEWERTKKFLVYIFSFAVGTYANMRALGNVNVETIIVFRSCVPVAISILEFFFYQRALPNFRSATALLLIVFGALGYISDDAEFQVLAPLPGRSALPCFSYARASDIC